MSIIICAHINPTTFEEQSVKEHLYNVSSMAMEYGAKISLAATCELIGVLHDLGKETRKFDAYIRYSSINPNDKSLRGSVNHSTAGAKFIYDNFYNTTNPYQRLTAQLISLAICSHHGGLIDCLDTKGMDIFTSKMETDEDIYYNEALSNFKTECMEFEQIGYLFNKAVDEIKSILMKINKIDKSAKFGQFAAGMLEKYVFSCLIDADRYDTYTFMEGKEQKHKTDRLALWDELHDVLETKIESFPKSTKIDLLREEISITCRDFGENKPGIYQLSVPTGGGKTLSSLRYALEHVRRFNKDRIFCIIPFTTIIDQNASEIKDILGRDDIVLEHHSNLVVDNEQEDYKLLTEQWDSPIIITTMVQFLDAIFSGGTKCVRRMHSLANSVIIFDEIQTIPIKCINIFNSTINFLSGVCNATILLCTATQPLLSTTEMPLKLCENPNIISDIHEKFEQFKRVNLVDKSLIGGYSAASIKDFVLEKMDHVQSVLVVLNTRSSAREVYDELKNANNDLAEEKQYLIFHLSTNMCAAHRLNVLQYMRENLGHKRLVCVSTQLIEAGVNISFGCVVRSIAGLDSIAQAAGRCNRHGESSCSDVYIVNVQGENVSKLVDIKKGQQCTERVLDEFKKDPSIFDDDLLSPKSMEMYYKYYFHDRRAEMNYTLPRPDNDKTIYDILSANNEAANAYMSRNGCKPKLMLRQAFKTAGDKFQVIDQNTTGLIVPYGEGEELITLINGKCDLSQLKRYLKKAQQFSVNLYEEDKRKLQEAGGIIGLKENTVLAVRKGFYREDIGVAFEGALMEFYNF